MAKTRRELDKDLMFQKIMPAIADNPFSTVYNANHSADNATPDEQSNHDAFQSLRKKVFSSTYMCDPGTEISVINIMENLVLGYLDSAMKKFNVCTCDKCKCYVAAFALNAAESKYVSGTQDEIRAAEAEVPQKVITDALIKAVISLRSNPQH
ncbi:MAG: late competence development ComFB family protein [Clostridia bacterium]|nr:late competence development ComFB family protein [Clostridia bacterium]